MSRNSSRIAEKSGWSVVMSNAASSMPRAPFDTCGRTTSAATGARLRRVRISVTVRAMSGAVSASVPSRSKSTASTTARSQQVVHVDVASQRIDFGDRVVRHAREVEYLEPGLAAGARQLRGPDEARVLVGALRQEVKDVLGAHDGEQERLGIAIDGGEEDEPAGLHELRARIHDRG